MKMYFLKKVGGSVVRHGLTALGGWMVAQGVIDEPTADTLVGAGMTLTGIALSVAEKLIRA